MSIRISGRCAAIVCAVLLAALPAIAAGCTSDAPEQTSTTGTAVTSSSATTESSTTTTNLMSWWDRELADTATLANRLSSALSEQGVPDNDPRTAIALGLRSRATALTCGKALEGANLELADTAMQDVRYLLNLARNVATGEVAQTLADARTTIETLGKPSDKPDEAVTLLKQFIETLAPLMDEGSALLPSTTTT